MYTFQVIVTLTSSLLLSTLTHCNDEEVVQYLTQYGYLNQTAPGIAIPVRDLEQGILAFQKFYNLPQDGMLNTETENLMSQPRCGMADLTSELVNYQKWNKTNLTWNFPLATQEESDVATAVFQVWQNVTKLNFERSLSKPDIVISYQEGKHVGKSEYTGLNSHCSFDGPGHVLAHAFFPTYGDRCREIHLDKSEDWFISADRTQPIPIGKNSLFLVLLHEVGHSLGLLHTGNKTDIMCGFYSKSRSTPSEHDIRQIQALYGPRQFPSITHFQASQPTSTSIPPTVTSTGVENYPDLCKIQPDHFLLTSSNKFYIFYQKWVWIFKVGEQPPRTPIMITDILPFATFDHIYQRPNHQIAIVRGESVHFLDYPRLKIVRTHVLSQILRKQSFKLNTIFNTYSGRTIVFFDDRYYAEISECDLFVSTYGLREDQFAGLSDGGFRVFRYINGNLYFFKNSTFYEFNEFSNQLVRAGQFEWSLFNIDCLSKLLLRKITKYLLRLAEDEEL